MPVPTLDTSRWEQMVSVFESMLQHRRAHPTSRSEELYYDLLLKYYRRPLLRKEEKKPVVAHCLLLPTELFVAMDVIPLHMEGSAQAVLPSLKNYEESFNATKGMGFPPEICSAHRAQIALFGRGWFPRVDAVVWSHQICDGSIKTGELYKNLWQIPGHFVDRAYALTEDGVQYYAEELEGLVHFLEDVAGHTLDKARLSEVMDYARRTVQVHREIYELRKAVPCPLPNRRGLQLQNIQWLYIGTPEGLAYHETVLQETREMVERKQGPVPGEKHRLLSLFPPPSHDLKILDWMEREHGAVIAGDPYSAHWGDLEWDDARPYVTLARKGHASPMSRAMHNPPEEGTVADIVEDAIKFKAQGAIYWAHVGCRNACALIRTIKDALREQVGIPTVVVEMDILDPSVVTDADMKDKLEGFFETLSDAG
ncbi:MAG: 2-hydroxyacyl-CoA dehydratase [Chloroflexi bacterium]|nr:2-hydroxyacyl-CoA dehydratase [Chloroflexota bacterium]